VIAIVVEVEDDLEQMGNLHRAALRAGGQVLAVGIEQGF
jgi:hypothetical protein